MNKPLYQYSTAYRVDLSSRVVHRTVIAHDADDARERVKAIDRRFLSTVRSPRRGRQVVEVAE